MDERPETEMGEFDDLHPTVIKLSPEAWDKFWRAIESPAPPNQALKDLMRKPALWDREEQP